MRHKRATRTKEEPLLLFAPSPNLHCSLSLSLSLSHTHTHTHPLSPSLSHPSMRIRRRPQAQALSSLRLSDPSTAPQPPLNASRNQEHWLSEGKKEEEKNKLEELQLHPTADLGDDEPLVVRRAALPLLPQDNVVVECSRSLLGSAQREGAVDGHRSLENGHHDKSEPVIKAGERLVNGVPAMPVATVAVNVKGEIKNDSNGGSGGVKKRRGPAVLMEGSRCSRVNGRGWRCSQPTLVGYSLCEHHLGKGRMRSVSGGRGGAAQLGRTEPRKNAAAVAVVTTAPKAAERAALLGARAPAILRAMEP